MQQAGVNFKLVPSQKTSAPFPSFEIRTPDEKVETQSFFVKQVILCSKSWIEWTWSTSVASKPLDECNNRHFNQLFISSSAKTFIRFDS